jgi:transcription initiation factor TFIID subunit 1, fungi type
MNKSGHRYNVQEQQKVYAEEKERIWNAQMRSLSRTDPPELTDDEDENQGKSGESPDRADSVQPEGTGGYRVMKIRRWVCMDKLN